MAGEFLLPAFRFQVTLTQSGGGGGGQNPPVLGNGGFAECSGLELEAEIKDYPEGGRNDAVIRRVGRVKLSPIVLKRGMFSTGPTATANPELWAWLTRMVRGELPIPRYDGRIQIMDPTLQQPLAIWTFDRGLPQKVSGPALNAKTGEVAIKELHIVHEGLRMGEAS